MENTHLDPARPPRRPTDPLHDLSRLGEYRFLRRLGEGGMGAVYLGWKEGENVQVAVKILNDQLASSQSYIDRFRREAKSGKLLNHPNIVRTLDYGQDERTGKHYLVLEYVDGPSANALLDRFGRLPIGDAVHIALDIARALEHAHSRSIIHRDIKPDNILITRAGVAKLADLGLAKRTDETSHLTSTRQGFGTTAYMPYEQAVNARSADGRSDIYALGATLYHLVVGAAPFPGESHLDVVEKKRLGDFPPAAAIQPDIPPLLDAILARMMARLPRDRYQTASELIVDLEKSQMSAAIPTFADPELAMKDPWMQACMAASGEPTRLDPERPPDTPEPSPAEVEDLWVVRFRNRAGRVCRTRATTEQITARLRRGRLPEHIVARRESHVVFHPLAHFSEFRELWKARKIKRSAPPADPKGLAASPALAVEFPRRRAVLLATGFAAALAAVAAALWTLLHLMK
ncbi:MAG TPA: serine/threonine-protein kinase [Gemmataceae bacterium]|nr:serine/threonine-protein kinase [Gemmataceae bacterium]